MSTLRTSNSMLIASSGGTYEQIARTTLAVASTIHFDNIPNSYKHLEVVLSGRSSATSTDTVYARLNRDTSLSYDFQLHYHNPNPLAYESFAANAIMLDPRMVANNASAGAVTNLRMTILNYSSTDITKSVISQSSGEVDADNINRSLSYSAGFWRSSNAISSISFILFSGLFMAGTTVAIYGIGGA